MEDHSKKPTLVLDVDGCILDFCKPFVAWWNDKYGWERGLLNENPGGWNMDYVHKENPDISVEIINNSITEFLMTGPMFPLMEDVIPKVISNLSKKYRIHIVTAYDANFAFLREENLRRFGIEYDEITYVDGHKAEHIARINPIAVVEDSPVHIQGISMLKKPTVSNAKLTYPIFVPSCWNYTRNIAHMAPPNVMFYDNWSQLETKINDLSGKK